MIIFDNHRAKAVANFKDFLILPQLFSRYTFDTFQKIVYFRIFHFWSNSYVFSSKFSTRPNLLRPSQFQFFKKFELSLFEFHAVCGQILTFFFFFFFLSAPIHYYLIKIFFENHFISGETRIACH